MTAEKKVPEGWELVTFGELETGDVVRGLDHEDTEVSYAFDEHIPDSMYEITASDGRVIQASGNHLWYIVRNLDRGIYQMRLKEGRALGKGLAPDSVAALQELAAAEKHHEISLAEMVNLVATSQTGTFHSALARVAESIGPIAEHNGYIMNNGEVDHMVIERRYNSRVFAQQLLSLFAVKRSYRKTWPVIIGSVLTTEELLHEDLDQIIIPESRNDFSNLGTV